MRPHVFAGLWCQCGERHYQGASYYVTVRRETRGGWEHRKLVGPFVEHAEALALVWRAQMVAESIDPKAVWYAFGTAAAWTTEPGMLNRQALEGCRECFRVPGTGTDAQDNHWRGCSLDPANRPRRKRRRPRRLVAWRTDP